MLEELSEKLGIGQEEVQQMTDALCDNIKQSALEMDSVAFPGFGSFEPKKRQERIAVHPSTGRRLLIPPKISLTFRPSASLKSKVKSAL